MACQAIPSTSGPVLLAGLPREPLKLEPRTLLWKEGHFCGRKESGARVVRLARQLDMIKTPLKFSQVRHQTHVSRDVESRAAL